MVDAASSAEEFGDHANNLVAAGALWAVLYSTADVVDPEPVYVAGQATNQIEYGLAFLKSRYRVTVVRVLEPDDEGLL